MTNQSDQSVPRLTKKQRRRSINFAIFGAVSAVMGGCCLGGNVLNLAVLKLGASEVYLGVLGFITMGSWCFRVFSMSAIERVGKRKVMLMWYWVILLFMLPFVLIPYLAGFWPTWACLALLLVASLGRNIAYALGNTGWFPLLQDVVPRQITGRFFANMRTGWQTRPAWCRSFTASRSPASSIWHWHRQAPSRATGWSWWATVCTPMCWAGKRQG